MQRYGLIIVVSVLVSISLFCLPSFADGCTVAYEAGNHIHIEGPGWNLPKSSLPIGVAPAVSPTGSSVAFLRDGNVFVIHKDGQKIEQITHDPSIKLPSSNEVHQYDLMPQIHQRISWNASESKLVYTRILLFKYDKKSNLLQELKSLAGDQTDTAYLTAIWIADINAKSSKQLVGPMGDFRLIWSTGQPSGAAVYEPVFSPDGSRVWFLNAGSLFESLISEEPAPKLAARIGDGLEYSKPANSKWGTGALQVAWDAKNSRLIYWIGRFWGSGESDYGYIPWHDGKWGKATSWTPKFTRELKGLEEGNIWGCAIDCEGFLWVEAQIGSMENIRWTRTDASKMLPVEAENPSFGL